MNKLFLIIAALTAFQAYGGGGSSVGPANPASVNCELLGGVLERVVAPNGESNNCVIDEWKLFREMDQRGLVKPRRYSRIKMPNPATVNCIDINGSLRIVSTLAGERGFCVVEEWDLFRAIDVTQELDYLSAEE